jgi:hypothetical protein
MCPWDTHASHITSFILRKFFAACCSRSISHTINGHRGTKRFTWILLKLKLLVLKHTCQDIKSLHTQPAHTDRCPCREQVCAHLQRLGGSLRCGDGAGDGQQPRIQQGKLREMGDHGKVSQRGSRCWRQNLPGQGKVTQKMDMGLSGVGQNSMQ